MKQRPTSKPTLWNFTSIEYRFKYLPEKKQQVTYKGMRINLPWFFSLAALYSEATILTLECYTQHDCQISIKAEVILRHIIP